jgi:4-cresol dehydrogenase (hydroxylating)
MLVVDVPDTAALTALVDVMRNLQLEGTVRAAPWFGNHYRLLGTVMRFPWHRATPPLRPEESAGIAAENGLAPWTCFSAIYGTAAQVAASQARVEGAVASIGLHVEGVDAGSLVAQPHSARRSIHLSMHRAYTGGILNAARRAYWRKRTPVDAEPDPDADGVGFIFVNASLPFRGADVVEAQHIAADVILAAGFEPSFSCHSIRERVLQGLSTFAWDRDVPGDDERAVAAHDRVSALWAERGWYPFRLGLHSLHLLEHAEPVHRSTVAAIRGALDPRGCIAPGHYA